MEFEEEKQVVEKSPKTNGFRSALTSLITRKKALTLFLLFFPSLLIAVIPSQFGTGTTSGFLSILGVGFYPFILKLLLIFYQFVIIKNFVDTHFQE